MRSSRGFASTAPNFVALFRLAFASAPRQRRLTLLVTVSRRIIMQKARHHPLLAVSYQLSAFSQTQNRFRLRPIAQLLLSLSTRFLWLIAES